MGRAEPLDELASLAQPRGEEAALDRQLDAARRDAERTLVEANAAAGRERELARHALSLELAERAAVLERARAAVVDGARAEAALRIEALTGAAEAGRARALALAAAAAEGDLP